MVPVIYIDSVFMILPWNLYVADSILPFVQMLGRNIFMKLVSKIRCELKLQLQLQYKFATLIIIITF